MERRVLDSKVSTQPHNLPAALSSFIGRKREVAEVRQLLRTERLVTLTGAGGSGKTRLALEVAGNARGAFENGVWLVELAPLSDATLVPQAVASTLDVREQPGRALAQSLIDFLESRQVLLVLDNCEHLVQACAELAQGLLQSCPALTILATSREPLGIGGETVRIVPPLSLPRGQSQADSEAVQLFVTRGQAAAAGFDLTAENAAVVAEICIRLDGLPLAIELAAARLRALSVEQLAALLGDRFGLLIGGSRTAPARQRTLEAALDWSYGLLSPGEQSLLQGLSVFAGGATLEAVEAVCAGDAMQTAEVRDVLAHLVDKSLVGVDQRGRDARYHLLETIREYGRRRLAETQLQAVVRDRHLDYFVGWSERTEKLLLGPKLPLGMQLFTEEHDNIRAALEWSLNSPGMVARGMRSATAASYFWRVVGHHSEGRQWLGTLLSHPEGVTPTVVRANALHRAALQAFYQSDYPACKALAEEVLEITKGLGASARQAQADATELLAEVASETGDYDTALTLYERALPIYEELDDLIGLGDTRKMIGWLAMRAGDYDRARVDLEQGLAICRRSGELRHISSALSGLGELAIRVGRYQEAKDLLSESLKLSRVNGEKWNMAINLGSLGWVAMRERNFTAMAGVLRESLAIRMETGDRGGMAWCLEKLGQAATLQSNFEGAARVFGAAEALRQPVGAKMDQVDAPEYERAITEVREALGEDALRQHWQAGARMALQDAIELALSEVEQAAEQSLEKPGGLTGREREVAQLVARGKSNREIAEAMTVSIKTVETYVTHILGKLGFESRVQVATWAMEQGLIRKEKS